MNHKEQLRMRLGIPYGKWSCKNRSTVLFNRNYQPLWVRSEDGRVSDCSPDAWIDFESVEYLYSDSNPPWTDKTTLSRCLAHLDAWKTLDRNPIAVKLDPILSKRRGVV